MWICEHCSEEVADNYEICWNCNIDKNSNKSEFELTNSNNLKNKETFSENLQINPHKLISAGKNIKLVVKYMIITILTSLIGLVFTLANPRESVIFGSITVIIGIISNILIFMNLYEAGDDLVNSTKSNDKK